MDIVHTRVLLACFELPSMLSIVLNNFMNTMLLLHCTCAICSHVRDFSEILKMDFGDVQ